MNTVFSYIVQKRFSQEYENIATEALAFILQSDESARAGLMKLLRGIAPGLPSLIFRTQQTDGNARPDMWGFDGTVARVFIENKFWAGLTENQPVTYLQLLAKQPQPTVLLVVVPAAREETIWRELLRRLRDANISVSSRDTSAAIVRSGETALGPVLALMSWEKLLSTIEMELADEAAKNDLRQLRALCDAADSQAFKPISSTELTDQRTPAFILQLRDIVEMAVDLAVTEGILSKEGLKPQSDWTRIGRYVWVSSQAGACAWFGTHFELWRDHGGTPLWLAFYESSYGRAVEVRGLLEPWGARKGVLSANHKNHFVFAINLLTGEEKEQVVRFVVDQLKEIAGVLSDLKPVERPK